MKIRLPLVRARPNFYMNSDNRHVSLGIVDCSLCTRCIAFEDENHKNDWTCLPILLKSSTIWRLLQKISSFLPDKTSSFRKTFSTMLQFVGLLVQWIQTLHSLDLILKIHSGINNSIADKLEHSEVISQMETLMRLIIVAYTLQQGKLWTFKMISPRFKLLNSKATMCSCLIWLQCKMLLKIVITQI